MDAYEASNDVDKIVEDFRRDMSPFPFSNGERHIISKTERDIAIVIVCIMADEKGTDYLYTTNNSTYRSFLKKYCNMNENENYTIPYHDKIVNAERIAQVANIFSTSLQRYRINWDILKEWILESGPSAKTFFEEKCGDFA